MKNFFSFLFGYVLLTGSIYAISITPATGSYNVGGSTNFTLTASDVTDNISAIQLRLHVEGGTIASYATDSQHLAIGVCLGGNSYTSTDICVDIANGSGILPGDTVGTFTVDWTTAGSFTFSKTGTNYINGTTQESVPDDGNIGTYTILEVTATPTPQILPRTANDNNGFMILLGLMIVTIGIYTKLYIARTKI